MPPGSEQKSFLFTDVEGSTRLWQQHPDQMPRFLARHDAVIRHAVDSHNGRIFKNVGDQLCAVFPRPKEALLAALTAQKTLAGIDWPEIGFVRVRMAAHTGIATPRGDDFVGPALNRISRVLSVTHGGQVVVTSALSNALEDLPADAELLDLGRHRLRDFQDPETLYQLCHDSIQREFPVLETLDTVPNNLPEQTTSFIGREEEFHEARRLLETSRMVTIFAAGGSGKTRLAQEIAADRLKVFPNGIWFVDLSSFKDPLLVQRTCANVLGVREESGMTVLEALVEHIADKTLLIILDNCEHLVSACSEVAGTMLSQCPNLHILATSREAMGIPGEAIYRLDPLRLPLKNSANDVEAVLESEAGRLFVDRLSLARADFVLVASAAPSVIDICHRLDGIPLAIELAAARAKIIGPHQVSSRLDDKFKLLTGGNRSALPKQQTLRAMIDWSYELLAPDEKLALCRCSVFVGGWTLDAAESVCDSPDSLDLITQLYEKSLIIADISATEPRFRCLETIREYAFEKLAESGELEAARNRHLEFFSDFATIAEPHLLREEQAHWLKKLDADYENLRSAMDWGVSSSSVVSSLVIAGSLHQYWNFRGLLSEGREQLDFILKMPFSDDMKSARAKCLFAAGALAIRQNDFEAAERLGKEGLALRREQNDPVGIATMLGQLGAIAQKDGDFDKALELLSESLAIQREQQNERGMASVLGTLGNLRRFQGDLSGARDHYEESLALRRKLGIKAAIADLLNSMGSLALTQGDFDGTESLSHEALVLFDELGDPQGIAESLEGLAMVAWKRRQAERVVVLIGAAEKLREEIGAPLSPAERAEYDAAVADVIITMGVDQFAKALDYGHKMPPMQAARYMDS